MTGAKLVAVALLAAACSSTPEHEHVQLDSIQFELPGGGHHEEFSRGGVLSAEWVPSDNARRESIVVMRTVRVPLVARGGAEEISRLLTDAQRGLPFARVGDASELTTRSGLAGARIDVDFVDSTTRRSYHRVHVVFIENGGASLVHVLYTAQKPNEQTLKVVLDTIRHEEA